jgi:fibro-slime domain-containing protein
MHTDRPFRCLRPAAIAAAAAGVLLPVCAQAQSGGDHPQTISLTGICRDFREASAPGGHPDFEINPAGGYGHYVDMVQDTLDQDGKPVFKSLGHKVSREWMDGQGRNIMPARAYIEARSGDSAGSAAAVDGGAITDRDYFAQWYRDTTGVNLSKNVSITLSYDAERGLYVYDDRTDPRMTMNGFFPINGQLYGNSAGDHKNYHFTYEIEAAFTYRRGAGEVFTFTGDDDVWVFIDGKLVIDLGGIHDRIRQSIDLDRLTWLEDGHEYAIHIFSAERHRTGSNFKIEANLQNLRTVQPPPTSALAD